MLESTEGMQMKLNNNKDFRSVTPTEFLPEGTLVWSERDGPDNIIIEGPYVIEEGWGPIWFGSPNRNKPQTKGRVKLISTVTGHVENVTWGSFLFTTYYVMNEERLCTDVETK